MILKEEGKETANNNDSHLIPLKWGENKKISVINCTEYEVIVYNFFFLFYSVDISGWTYTCYQSYLKYRWYKNGIENTISIQAQVKNLFYYIQNHMKFKVTFMMFLFSLKFNYLLLKLR